MALMLSRKIGLRRQIGYVPLRTSRESYLRFCKAAGTLIVPPWILAHYWVSLCKTEFTGTILSMIG